MQLLLEYFNATCRDRGAELLWCLHENLNCNQIDKVHVFMNPSTSFSFDSPKLEIVNSESRVTYQKLFDYCNKQLKGKVCIIANGDIIFNESLDQIRMIDLDSSFVALSRWEINLENGIETYSLFDNPHSQDCWIFKSPVVPSESMDFHLGIPGCDNRIARIMHNHGLEVINPSQTIQTIHFHSSKIRNYVVGRDLIQGPYLSVWPTKLEKEFTSEHQLGTARDS